jgi:hypothetical protein
VVFLAASLWRRSVKERLLVKSRSAGERIEIFMATWLNSQEQGTHTERTGYGNRQKSRYCWGPWRTCLSHEVDALVHSDARRAEVWRLQVFHIASLLAFHGSLLLRCSVRPQHRPFQIRKVDREYILW